MEKSFYYLIPTSHSDWYRRKFTQWQIPHICKTDSEDVARDMMKFIFPDLPVRQYNSLWKALGIHGKSLR